MPENMMNKAHKATNQQYRDNYDRTFDKDNITIERDDFYIKHKEGEPLYR